MNSPNNHPGNFILEVGKIGTSLLASFTKFITYRKVQDRRLENLYATLSITATTLTELGTTINKYENDFRIKDEAFRPICETAKANLEKFLILINEGISSGVWKNDGRLGGQTFTAEVDPWLLITVSLGGKDQAKDFWQSLDDTRDSLLELNDIVKYMILKNISQERLLNQEQSDEFRNLTALLPHLVHSVEKSEQTKKEEAAFEKAKFESIERMERMDREAIPPMCRDLDDASDTTFVEPKPRGREAQIGKEYHRDRSIDSFVSYDSLAGRDVRKSYTCEVYEEWLLRYYEPMKNPNCCLKLFGILNVTQSYQDPGFWSTNPEFRTQAEMKEQHQFAARDLSSARHKEVMQKAVRAIPKKGGLAIDQLLEDRTVSSNHEAARTIWEVVSIRPKQKFSYSSSKKWGKDPKTTDWRVTLRGEKVDAIQRSQPFRRADPWARESSRRYRSPERRMYERERSFSPEVRVRRQQEPIIIHPENRIMFHPRSLSPPRRGATMEAIPDEGFRPGTMVIGKIPSQEEAEKKIEEIWALMTGQVTEDVVA